MKKIEREADCGGRGDRLRNSCRKQFLAALELVQRLVVRLRRTWRFVTFNEENPKHNIVDSTDALKAIAILTPLVIVFGACSTVAIMYLVKDIFLMSAITLFAYPLIYGLVTLELLHIAFDR